MINSYLVLNLTLASISTLNNLQLCLPIWQSNNTMLYNFGLVLLELLI